MRIKIEQIAYYLPERVVTNQELHEENPSWDIPRAEKHTGVFKRHIAADSETALDMSFKACQKLFLEANGLKGKVDGIICCTQSGDYIMPPNSCILHGMLELPDDVLAFDFNLACSGYIYGLALAQGLICSGLASNILLVTADTYSKYISEKDRSTRLLFGDGAAATWITGSGSQQGIIDIQCSTSGKGHDKFMVPAGGCRVPKSGETSRPETDRSGNTRTAENIKMDGMGILSFAKAKIPQQVTKVLARNEMTVEDIDLFVFHQASKVALDSLTRTLRINPEKVFQNLQEVGNTVSASIPIALKDALQTGRVAPGDKVLLCGFGVGLSWGTAILSF